MATTTWKPHEKHGELAAADRNELPDSAYAFPKKRKEPLTDAKHVRNALARFDQVEDVPTPSASRPSPTSRRRPEHYGVDMTERTGTELGKP
jgi:hypothetical protein